MTLDQLRIFLAVAERQHVTHAARALNLTQSAVSAAISALEARHGVRLFDRVGRGIALTEDGRAFMAEARAVLDRAETAAAVLDDLSREPRGRLRIHASQTVASHWLPPRLMALHDLHPRIEFRMILGNTRQVADAVAEGVADLGFVEGDVTQGDLHRQVVARDQLVLVMSAGHPLEQGATPAQMSAYRWVLREPGSGTRAEFEAWLTTQGLSVDALSVAIEMPSNEAVLSAVANSQCLAVLSHRAVASAAGAGWVRFQPLAGAERRFSVLTDPRRHRTRAIEALLRIATAPEP
ncbi:LysR substrate-binding domain-containing protein [Paracoccus laeviglucosivorans]|uniref:DNA-binding transcriptional regulator, LysR family n=1 Tax=Paracoccus laeviglucosivorans TaxID=1197861 RepID=A0A521B3J0_9RHOB|nr:LysR substrate-binding domain-containing protein [Paracoccus laeviglucosivorans]SMO41652.1 DNA-binding transcriptional regulator, LysR family [Paracoccus laeviglucosivorans]